MQPVTVLYKVHNLDREKARSVLASQKQNIIAAARAQGDEIPRFLTAGTDNFLRPDETYYNEDQHPRRGRNQRRRHDEGLDRSQKDDLGGIQLREEARAGL